MQKRKNTTSTATRAFIAACIGMAFFGITMVALGSVMPWLSAKLSLTVTEKATLASLLTGGILLGSLIFGPVCDHYGHKNLFLLSSAFVMFGIIGISVAHSLLPLYVSYLLIGVGGGVLNGQTNTLVTDIYESAQSAAKLSLLGAFYGVGGMLITFVVAMWGEVVPLQYVLWGIVLVLSLCFIYCMSVKFPAPKQPQSFPLVDALKLLREPVLIILSLVLLLESSVETITNNLSTVYMSDVSNPVLLLTVMMGAITVARFVLSWLSARYNSTMLLYCFLLLLVIGFGIMIFAHNMVIATMAMIFIGFGTAATYPVVLGCIGAKYATLSGTAFGLAITIALAGSTLLNGIVGGLLLNIYPYVMMCFSLLMIVFFAVGKKGCNKV